MPINVATLVNLIEIFFFFLGKKESDYLPPTKSKHIGLLGPNLALLYQ